MAQHKTKQEYKEMAIKAITDYKLIFITDIPPYIGISRGRFYQIELDKDDDIKELLEQNRINIKVGLRKKWYESDNPTLQIILFKLTAEDDERKRISTNYSDITSGDKPLSVNRFGHMTDEELAKLGKELSHLMAEDHDEPEDDNNQPATT